MKKLEFDLLRPEDIEVRVATVSDKGCSLLLYKDARCDMNMLDKTVGAYNWKREHSRDNANCVVSLWDEEKNEWVSKEDTGTESFTEKEKGLASDSFKRACFNWGIGRELYTAPFIWVPANLCEIADKNGKKTVKNGFEVLSIGYDENRRIQQLVILNAKTSEVVFEMGVKSASKKTKKSETKAEEYTCKECGKSITGMKYKGQIRTAKECNDAFGGYCLECYKKGKDNK